MANLHDLRPSWVRKIEVTHVDGVSVAGPCWLWRGCIDKVSGYGRVTVQKRGTYLHRATYELVAPIPDGLSIDHLCRQRACCNPAHLEPVTPKVNSERGERATQTHCRRAGHPLSGENLRIHVDKRGYEHRICRQCNRDSCAAWQRARADRQSSTWAKYLPAANPAA